MANYSESIANPACINDVLAAEHTRIASIPALAEEIEAQRNDPVRVAQIQKQVEVSTQVARILMDEDGIHTLIASGGNLVFCTDKGEGFRETPWSSFGLNLSTVEEWVAGIRDSHQRYLNSRQTGK